MLTRQPQPKNSSVSSFLLQRMKHTKECDLLHQSDQKFPTEMKQFVSVNITAISAGNTLYLFIYMHVLSSIRSQELTHTSDVEQEFVIQVLLLNCGQTSLIMFIYALAVKWKSFQYNDWWKISVYTIVKVDNYDIILLVDFCLKKYF